MFLKALSEIELSAYFAGFLSLDLSWLLHSTEVMSTLCKAKD